MPNRCEKEALIMLNIHINFIWFIEGGGGRVCMLRCSLPPQAGYHENNRDYDGREPAKAKQLVYFPAYCFKSCREQRHKDSVGENNC